jgi:hypothetical protein
VPARFLAHVERGQIKAEALRQPDQIGQFAVGDRTVAVRDQGIADQVQVFEKRLLGWIAPERNQRRLGMPFGPRPRLLVVVPQAVIHQEQLAPIRFLGVLAGRVGEQGAHLSGVRVQTGGEHRRRFHQRAGISEMPVQLLDPPQVFAQDFLGLQAHRQGGGFRRDERVAVAVAADPRTEPQQARNADRRLAALVAVHGVQRPLQVAIEHRQRLENGLAEVVQTILDLVAHLRLEAAHLVGFPQDLNLATQRFDHLVPLVRIQRRIVELTVGYKHPPLRAQQDPAFGLGGMGGEHRRKAKLIEQDLQPGGIDAVGAQSAQGLVEGAAPERFAALDLFAAQLVLEVFLGDVGEIEVGVESPNDVAEHFRIESGDEAHQLFAVVRRGLGVTAQLDEALAQGFHGLKNRAAFLVAQGVAQQLAEQLDTVAQRLVGWGRHV